MNRRLRNYMSLPTAQVRLLDPIILHRWKRSSAERDTTPRRAKPMYIIIIRSSRSLVFTGRSARMSCLSLPAPSPPSSPLPFLSWCLTSTEAGWPIRDGDRVGRGRESDWLDRGNRPKKTGETVDRRQNNGSVKAVSPRHCPATCALCNCSFNCCAGQSH